MVLFKTLPASMFLIISLVVLQFVHSDDKMVNIDCGCSPPEEIDCGARCSERCQVSGRPKMCLRACGTCCERCNCVPPGTSGNYDFCPCYANMTTHGGRHKCP